MGTTVPSLHAVCLILSVLHISLTLAQSSTVASDGYEVFPMVRGSRYQLKPYKATWHEAVNICQREGGGAHLVVINSNAEADVVSIFFSRIRDGTKYLYVGINDLAQEGRWVTVTGELVSNSGYSKWLKKQPDNRRDEDCGTVVRNGGYNDLRCKFKQPFICEKPNV